MFGDTSNAPLLQLSIIGASVPINAECSGSNEVEFGQFVVQEAASLTELSLLFRLKAKVKIFKGSTVYIDKEYFVILNFDQIDHQVFFENVSQTITSGSNSYENIVIVKVARTNATTFTLSGVCCCYARGNMTGRIAGNLQLAGTVELIRPYTEVIYRTNEDSIKADFIPV